MSLDPRVLVALCDGAALLALALVAAVYPRDLSSLVLARACRQLAPFALLRGVVEWMDLLAAHEPVLPANWTSVRLALLVAACAWLLRFGLRMLAGVAEPRGLLRIPLGLAVAVVLVPLGAGGGAAGIELGACWVLASPGAVLAAVGLVRQLRQFEGADTRPFTNHVRVAVVGLVIYALVGAFAAFPVHGPGPSGLIAERFTAALGFPVYMARGAAVIAFAFGLIRALGVLRVETVSLLATARGQLEARVAERTASLRQANDDITHHKAARERIEAAWHASEADLAITLQSVAEAVISTNGIHQIVRLNPAAERLLGTTVDDALGRPLSDVLRLVDEGTGDELAGTLLTALSPAGGNALPPEALLVAPDGARRAVALSCAPMRASGGKHMGSVLVLRDVGDRRRLEARLRLSDRLMSLGTLAAGVAHEINNPLTYVTLNLDLVTREIDALRADLTRAAGAGQTVAAAEPAGRLAGLEAPLRDAQEGALRVRRVAADLRLFARNDDAAGSLLDVREVAEAACSLAWNEIRHRARLVKNLGEVRPVEGGEARLGQVLVNLLVNAAQAIPEGHAERNTITVSTGMSDEGRVFIEVRDTGCGIPASELPLLFDPFTPSAAGGGTGVGLSICHGIVQQLGGSIAVESDPGSGTAFRVELPVAHALPPDLHASAPRALVPVSRARVLLVDDEALILRTVQRGIGRDVDLTALASAEEALELLSSGQRFDVILCDLMMPTMSGMELHAELARTVPDQAERMVFVTGGAFTNGAREFLSRVASRQLSKPIDVNELRRLIAERTLPAVAPAVVPAAGASAPGLVISSAAVEVRDRWVASTDGAVRAS